MINQHGLNEENSIKWGENDQSIELSEVTHLVSVDTNNLSVGFKESG